jgi:hypothetical protein
MKPNRSTKLSGGMTGLAGEYLVAAELTRRGYVASLTFRNTRGIDILASHPDALRTVGIQVKTNNRDRRAEWILTQKAEAFKARNHFYVFVILNGLEFSAFHVVPSNDVARFVKSSHRSWLKAKSSRGVPHRDNPLRKFKDYENEYRDRWDLLGLD